MDMIDSVRLLRLTSSGALGENDEMTSGTMPVCLKTVSTVETLVSWAATLARNDRIGRTVVEYLVIINRFSAVTLCRFGSTG